MLTATEARKASVQGRFRKPSTKRSEVVKPTSNKPPTISHSQGMTFLSLDEPQRFVTLSGHDEARHDRQQNRAAALPRVHGDPPRWLSGRNEPAASLGARDDERVRSRRHPVPR